MKRNFGISLVAALMVVAAVTIILTTSPTPVHAVGPATYTISSTVPTGSDPCENISIPKASASVAITSATTTNLVSAVAGNFITVCGFQMSVVGTSPTVQFEYGTTVSTACDTGATALSGAFAIPTTTIFVNGGGAGLKLRTPVSQQLCLVTGGTITGVEGYISYVSSPY